MIECVPNFSEGRDSHVILLIAGIVGHVNGVNVLGFDSDADHHRSVITFAGQPPAVLEAAVRCVGKASSLIDLRQHTGVHPRVGSTDVLPFVPLAGSTLDDCVHAAHQAGAEIWRRFSIPVYFYEAAARSPSRRQLQHVRRTGFDGQSPDIGDVPAHPTAGAVMVGARHFLIAYNINLTTPDAAMAQAIARKIRESSGGFRFVKAMGLYLESRGCAQVSMNLTNFAEIPLDDLYTAVVREAAALGTSILESELIGFIPKQAYDQAPAFFDRIRGFNESRIIENRLLQLK
jgi:glutamate formiminotransferase